MSNPLNRCTGDNKPFRWFFTSKKTRRPAILTGHTIVMELSVGGQIENIPGLLYEGDCGVYFDVPDTINTIAGSYEYKIIDTDTNGDKITIEKGIIRYS